MSVFFFKQKPAYEVSYGLVGFFFNQKTAYGFLLSLVGSDMCIRDRDKEVLKRGQYLSTGGVVEQVCEDCKRRGQVFQDVQVIAHPLHLPRCIKQSQQTFISQGLNVNVSEAGLFTIPPWDDTGAQVWCRSLSNWLQYEEIVLRLMSKSGS